MALRPHRQTRDSAGLAGTNLARAGDYNQRVVLQAIRAKESITRAELAAVTGLTHQSAINITKKLLAEGVILEVGRAVGARGQPAAQLSIAAEGAFALGLNIDRDHITLVLIDLLGQVRERFYLDSHFALPADVLAFVRRHLDDMQARRLIPRGRLAGLGIAIPERLSGVAVADRPEAYGEWATIDVVEMFSEALNLPVYVENDATSAAIGELQMGHGFHHRTFVYTLISAGIGCGLIVNGQPFTGGLAHAGEIGNIPIRHPDPAKAYLWHAVSLYAIYDDLASKGLEVHHPDDLNADDPKIAAAIDAWVIEAADCMIEPFLAITYILSPEVHFIGGQLPTFIVEKLCAELNSKLPRYERDVPLTEFRPASYSVDAASLGAAVLVLQNRLLPQPQVLSAAATSS